MSEENIVVEAKNAKTENAIIEESNKEIENVTTEETAVPTEPINDEGFQKIRKKRTRISIEIIIVTLLVIFGYIWVVPHSSAMGQSGLYQQAEVEQQMQSVVELFNAERYSVLQSISTKSMKSAMSAAQLIPVRNQCGASWSGFQSMQVTSIKEVKQFGKLLAVGEVTATYSNKTVVYTIKLNEELKIAGFDVN